MSNSFIETNDGSGAFEKVALIGIAQLVFLILKTTGSWNVSWAWTFSPLTIFGGLTILLILLFNPKV